MKSFAFIFIIPFFIMSFSDSYLPYTKSPAWAINTLDDFGPFSTDKRLNINSSIKISNKSRNRFQKVTLRLSIEIPNFLSKRCIYISKEEEFRAVQSKTFDISYGGNYLRGDELRLTFDIYVDATPHYSLMAKVLISPLANISGRNAYLNKIYTSTDRRFRILDNNIFYVQERVDFKNFNNYIDVKNDYELDLSAISFTYKTFYETFNPGDLYLYFPLEYFPYLNNEPLKLELVDSNKTVSFSYKKNMYYDPQTLDMSYVPIKGFKPTNKFYFPRNKLKALHLIDFDLEFPCFGVDKVKLIFSTKYFNTHLPFGNCSDADYCVVGGVK